MAGEGVLVMTSSRHWRCDENVLCRWRSGLPFHSDPLRIPRRLCRDLLGPMATGKHLQTCWV
eukprot:6530516-Pyramimonas_sp.AAC.1